MERTLIIIKPDAVQRGLIGEIIRRFENRGLRIAGMKFMQVTRELAARHYAEHEGKGFYEGLLNYITSAPVVVIALEGKDAIAIARNTIGKTKPMEVGRNLVHGSDKAESAERELGIFFAGSELYDWSRDVDRWIFED